MSKSQNEPKPPRQPVAPSFTPVPVRYRHDGWTAERQIAFVEALADCACVDEAARRVGMSATSAYALRWRPRAGPFRQAWDACLEMQGHMVHQSAITRSIKGVARPIFYKGEQVGEWRYHDERLTAYLLRYARSRHFGAWRDREPAPPPDTPAFDNPDLPPEDPVIRFDGHCEEIAYTGWSADPEPEPGPDGDEADVEDSNDGEQEDGREPQRE